MMMRHHDSSRISVLFLKRCSVKIIYESARLLLLKEQNVMIKHILFVSELISEGRLKRENIIVIDIKNDFLKEKIGMDITEELYFRKF